MNFWLYHIPALALGFLAWGLAAAAIGQSRTKRCLPFVFGSFALSLVSLLCPLLWVHHLESADQFSALYDLTGGLSFGGQALILITLLLNGIALLRYWKTN